jgi:signal transduction histidine kinase
MLTQYALVLSIILQFAAVVIVVSLIRSTKYNSSWILLSIGLLVMAVRRLIEYLPLVDKELTEGVLVLNSWLGVLISLLMLVGMFYVKKVLNHMFKLEEARATADKRLLSTVIHTEEKERRRLAKELHDGMGPLLSSVKMAVSALAYDKQVSNRSEIISNAMTSVDEAINTLKEISHNLSPYMLDNFGLKSAVKAFIQKIEQTGGISIEFQTNIDNRRYPDSVEIIFYRAVCELITNTLKHAHAKKILISLNEEDNLLKLLFQDDGKGFDFEKIITYVHPGMGLNNIRSRINSLNGKFDIESWPGEGIIVSLEVGLADDEMSSEKDKQITNISQ